MFGDFLYKLKRLRYTRPLAHARTNLIFYWHTKDKDGLIFFGILSTIVVAFVLLFYTLFSKGADTKDLTCLSLNIYHEARGEPKAGQYAVAEVTMNRVASRRYPNTVCKVVYQKNWDRIRKRNVGAFSWTEFHKLSPPEGKHWRQAWRAAETVYYQRRVAQIPGALFYHANYIQPSWAKSKKPMARIGRHIFYK